MRNIYLKKVINNDEMIKNPPLKKSIKNAVFHRKVSADKPPSV